MRHGEDECVQVAQVSYAATADPVLVLRVLRGSRADRATSGSMPYCLQLPHDVGHAAVAQIGDVLLEREAEDADLRALHRQVRRGSACFTMLLRDVLAHAVVDPAAGEDDLGW